MNDFIDVHCHLTEESEYEGVGGAENAVRLANESGVSRLVVSGFDLPSSIRARRFSADHKGVFFCAGLQPEELRVYVEGKQDGISRDLSADIGELSGIISDKKCVAVGEIGLDYHFPDGVEKSFQREAFVLQLRLAKSAGLPVVVHSRDACADTLAVLRENRDCLQKGFLMHCFSYAAETVEEFASLGAYFSFGGVVTFKKAEKVKRAALAVPKDRLLTETDSPYLTPEPFRGTFPNQPKNVVYVSSFLARLRGEEEGAFCSRISVNAERLFPALAAERAE